MRMKEKEREQNIIIKLSSLIFLAGFMLPGFDFHYEWSHIPIYLVLTADAGVFLGYTSGDIVSANSRKNINSYYKGGTI